MRQTLDHPLGRLTQAGLHINEHLQVPMPMRFWDTFSIVYVLTGRARYHDVDGLTLPLRSGDLLMMFPGHGYCYHQDPKVPWSEFWLQFQGPVFELWRQRKLLDPARPIYHLTPIEKWLVRLENLVRRRPIRGTDQMLRQVCRFQDLLAEIVTSPKGGKDQRPKDVWLSQALAVLDKQALARAPHWHEISAVLGLSYDRFRRKFADLTGVSPAKYLTARRLETACVLLHDRSRGLKEIAAECGFCDIFHFSKRFKQGMRLTPTEYRQLKLPGPE